jgi:tRNA pseudouridine32 synthase/23S rRNA pseudouridine746 synthase
MPPQEQGRIELPLARRSDDPRSWWMKVDPEGQSAVTDFCVLGRSDSLTWLELRPLTGRTHQLRVHLAAVHCPILGDAVYGNSGGPPLHLHARSIAVPLYPRRPAITATAPPPEHMIEALQACGLDLELPASA